ncbi:hypothetical protein GCM10023107_08250 [Actinoplanes octamycinicus]|nr:hypothetical protein Aoc01nite_09780 [Actinoplanes octamycinicus]
MVPLPCWAVRLPPGRSASAGPPALRWPFFLCAGPSASPARITPDAVIHQAARKIITARPPRGSPRRAVWRKSARSGGPPVDNPQLWTGTAIALDRFGVGWRYARGSQA